MFPLCWEGEMPHESHPEKKPSSSSRRIIKQNDLLQSSSCVRRDKGYQVQLGGEGKPLPCSQTARLAPQVRGSLQEAPAGSAGLGRNTKSTRKGGEGRDCPAPGQQTRNAPKQEQGQVSTGRCGCDPPVILQAGKPFGLGCLKCPGGD